MVAETPLKLWKKKAFKYDLKNRARKLKNSKPLSLPT